LRIEERRILSPDNEPADTVMSQTEVLQCGEFWFEYLDLTGEKPRWLKSWTGPDRPAALPFAIRAECTGRKTGMRIVVPLDYAWSAVQGLIFQ